MKLAWLTDTHLDFVSDEVVIKLAESIRDGPAEAVMLTGDITTGDLIHQHFRLLSRCGKTIYFVFGNHDYWHSTFVKTRMAGVAVARTGHVYLTVESPVILTKRSFIVGHDGWADGRAADFFTSGVDLYDYYKIGDFVGKTRVQILELMRRFSDDGAEHLIVALRKGFEEREHGFLLTHAPPFRETHKDPYGNPGNDDWAPHFVQLGLGEKLLDFMRRHPMKKLTVLCGHTHTGAYYKPLDNLEVRVGDAHYGQPEMTGILEVE